MHKINSSFNIYTCISIALCSATLLSTISLSSSIVSANTDSTDTVSLTVPIACTMTGTDTAHTAILNPGTYSGASGSEYANGIGKTTLTAICNDDNGFSIYAIGYTGNSYDSENHTKLVGANTGGTIATKAYASGDTTSNWSMKLTKVDNPQSGDPITYNPQNLTIQSDTEGAFSSWHSVPASYTKVAEYHANTGSSTTDTTLGVKLETTYAAYIASNQPADTYIGQVKYTMVHPYNEEPLQPQPSTARCINYHANASNAVGSMGCQSQDYDPVNYSYSDIVDGGTVTLLASNFSRTGYGFAGWSDKFDYATNPNAKFYGPQETITVPTGTEANGLSLYAVWIKSQGSIQDQSKVASVCSSLTTAPTDGTANLSSVSALTDQRDNNTYAIAKLADGKCWMIENLRLEAEDTRTPEKQALAQGYGTSTTYGNFSGLADAESTGFSSTYSANSLYSNDGSNDTINIGTSNYPGYRMPRYNNLNTPANANDRPQNPTSDTFTYNHTTVGMYSYGNYYTWHAAMANTIYYSSPTAQDADGKTSETVGTSLCPTGWRLPIGNQSTAANSFGALSVALGGPANGATANSSSTPTGAVMSTRFRSFPNNFLYSGHFNTMSAYDRGSIGYYWSSTAISYYNSYHLYLDSSNVKPGTNYYNKSIGSSIRCTLSAGT